MRVLPLLTLSLCSATLLLSGGRAHAQQQTYNPDGTPSMISPDGVFNDNRARGTGAVAPSTIHLPDPNQPMARQEERYDIDCDPDIDNCADPDGQQAYDDGYDPNAYQQFESALSPYGNWVEDPSYGRVWVPSQEVVGNDFEPYQSSGQWVASNDYGFTWVSDYDWGWAPFHYGRWTCLDGYGWGWVPGSLWGPAWVDWRYGGGYVGWAPLAPRGVVVPPPGSLGVRNPWRFALGTELFRRNPTLVPAHVAATVWARTSPVRNQRVIGYGSVNARINLGPPLAVISRDLGRPIPAMALKNTAPSVLPRSNVVPQAGTSVAQRPYMRGGAPTMRMPSGVQGRATMPQSISAPQPYRLGPAVGTPMYRGPQQAYPQQGYHPSAPPYAQPVYRGPQQGYAPAQPYRGPSQTYSPPSYQTPSQTYAPAQPYRGPSQTYSPPSYHSPSQTYSPQPSYRGPSQTYSPQPSYHAPAQQYSPPPSSRPAQSAPSFGGGGHRRH